VRISIVHPYLETGDVYREEPLGAEYLAAIAEEQDHQVQIVDGYGFNLDEPGLYERVDSFSPDLLAVSVPMTPQFPDGMALAEHVRATHPEVKICVGGNYPTFACRTLIQEPYVDYIVLHEGERSFAGLLEALDNGTDPGLATGVVTEDKVRDGGELTPYPLIEDLDSLPLPSRHLTPEYPSIYDTISLIASRGCPFDCVNCSTTAMWLQTRRSRSVDSVIAEIEQLVSTYPQSALNFVDDFFSGSRRWMRGFCTRYEPIWRAHERVWMCNTRLDTLDEDLLELMGSVGCRLVFLGVESGSDKVLDEIGKHHQPDRVLELLRACVDNQIQPNVALMMGLPFETREDLQATVELARRIVDAVPTAIVNVRPVTPMLGTPLYDRAGDYGVTIHKDDQFHLDLKEPRISTRHLSKRDLAAAMMECKIAISRASQNKVQMLEKA
jgi:radical SAM superfamily enzyme YgiQ (UPF0313 family)